MRFQHIASVAIAVGLISGAVIAADGKHAAHERHEKFEELGESFEKLEKQAKKSKPDAAVIQREAATILTMGKDIPNWFPAGSGPADGVKTHALADVWTQPAVFNDLQQKFIVAAEQLNQKAMAGDMSVIKAEVEHTGETCSECHKKFRKESSIFSIFGG